ncbi:MAG TPA: hypothetical protein VHK69_02035, partial [Chitinophagaceae bacterium]|nr:hypothetical protein [Chitinophagaceae bacterium]
MNNLTIWDLVLTPIFLLILYGWARRTRDRNYHPRHPLYSYYLPGLMVKFGGAIFIGLIYEYYYKGGDTFHYFYHSKVINSALGESVEIWVNLLLRTPVNDMHELYPYVSQMYWYRDVSAYTVSVVAAIFGVFTNNSYMPIALLFAFMAYSGIWAMYKTFYTLYPNLHRELAIAFLFIPSTFVWGSGLFKDTLCMFGLGWMTYTTFRIFINRDFSIKNITLLVLSFYLVALIKVYILMAFLPALSLWLLMTYSSRLRSAGARWLINILFVGVTVGGFLWVSRQFASELNRYSLENLSETARITNVYIQRQSGDEGSAYSLGEMDGSVANFLTLMPSGIVVTLFRPFVWEARKLIVLISALEALIFLYFTVRLFFVMKRNTVRAIFRDPNIIFLLV